MFRHPPAPEGPGQEDRVQNKKRFSLFKRRTRKPSFVLAVIINCFRMLVLLVLIAGLSGIGLIAGIAKTYVDTAPVLDLAKIDDQAQTSFFYDRDSNLITDYKGTENRIMVSIDTMPHMLRDAFVAAEDIRFYSHNGIDVKRIIGAFVANFVSGSQQGGSTITQQLIKNTVLTNELSYKRKIQEAYLAMQLEASYSKDEILESYLNTIYLGENYYGVKVAAMGYFGKELHQLTLRECAMLAGMTTNPYYYNIRRNLYTRSSPEIDYVNRTNIRTNYVLRTMYESQLITQKDFAEALNPASAAVLREDPESKTLYPYTHYVEYAVRDTVQVLLNINKLENTAANRAKMEQELRTGGYKVYLALDTKMQTTLEDVLYNYKDYPGLRDPGTDVFRSRNPDGTFTDIIQPQAGAAIVDYRTGELKAIVGSRTRPTTRKTLNRAVDMNMPVGSSIKPISVYAPAFDMGAGAGSIAYNMPLPITGWRGSDGRDSWPQNYGGSSYRGPETFRTALVQSDNTAAAYVLTNYVGVDRSVDYLRRLGVSDAHINATPFGVALGSSGISPLEMAVAFGVLANGGVYQQPISILGILDSNDKVIYDAHQSQQRRQVFKPSTAWLTVDILKDVVSKGTGRAARIKGQTVAGKTGTNSDQKGVFFAGMTGWYSAAVWIGHDNYKALSSKTTGGNSAAKLWQTFMQRIHQEQGLADRDILQGGPESYGLVKATTCLVSGQLATEACRHDAMGYGTSTDYYAAESVPKVQCQMHHQMNVCTLSGQIAGPYCPPETVTAKGVLVLPLGHPLEKFAGTQYSNVLSEYLGSYSTIRFTDNLNANQALLSAATCSLHQHPSDLTGGIIGNTLLPDAQNLIVQASQQLSALEQGTPQYDILLSAINNLNMVLNSNPGIEELANAMGQLTQAMAATLY
ncbi:MAG: transglycosylase domain-containing protein [Bacillota bacterium]|nr:transglycosylase domain-containing protein [Bacillota bacterium]